MTLGKKIALGYAGILSLTVIVGISGYMAMGYVMKGIALYRNVQKIQKDFSDGEENVSRYLLNNYDEGRKEQAEARNQAGRNISSGLKVISEIKGYQFGAALIRDKTAQIGHEIREYLSKFEQYATAETRKSELEKNLAGLYIVISDLISKAGFLTENMRQSNELLHASDLAYFSRNTRQRWERIEIELKSMKAAVEEWYGKIERSPSLSLIGADIRTQFESCHEQILQYHDEVGRQDHLYNDMIRHRETVHNLFLELGAVTSEQMSRFRRSALILLSGITLLALAAGSLYAYLSARGLLKPIHITADYLRRLSGGDIPEPMTHNSSDEFNEISNSMNILIEATNSTIRVAEKISHGDLNAEITERSEHDLMMKSLNLMIHKLKAIMNETNMMIQSVGEGILDVRGNAESFDGGWRELVTGVNNLIDGLSAVVSEKAALGTEMELAKKIQTVLLPKHPEISGYEISASCQPADEVGGDYYDVISVGGFDWIVIGDVSGHGVTSGLVMMMVQTAIHTVLVQNPEVQPSQLLWVINRVIYENIARMDESKHMTIVVLAAGREGKFSFSGLHEDMLIRRAETGKVENVSTDGMWIGLEPDISKFLSDSTLKMEPGDCAVLYTDGIIEARSREDGSFFGEEYLIAIVGSSGKKSASEIHADILDALETYETPDDVTLFVMKRAG